MQEKYKLVYIGIATGMTLLLLGLVLYVININIWRLTFCTGFGIILASFGTSAAVKYKSMTITGSGAISVILYLLITYYGPGSGITHIVMYGDFTPETQIIVEDREELLGAFRGKNQNRYRFIIEDSKLFRSHLTVNIDDDIVEVHKKFIEPHLRKGRVLEWEYDTKQKVIKDKETGKEFVSGAANDSLPKLTLGGFIAEAAAQTNIKVKTGARSKYKKLFNNLRSNRLRVRKRARTALAAKGIEVIRPSMKALHANKYSYRATVVIMYILARTADRNPDSINKLRSELSEADLVLLVRLANNPDKQIWKRATDFLVRIADNRAVPYALDILEQSVNAGGKYNAVQIIKSALANQADADKQKTIARLKTLRKNTEPKTRKLIDSLLMVNG